MVVGGRTAGLLVLLIVPLVLADPDEQSTQDCVHYSLEGFVIKLRDPDFEKKYIFIAETFVLKPCLMFIWYLFITKIRPFCFY